MQPDRAVEVLATIEAEASRTLAEMRTVVRPAGRRGRRLCPRAGIADLPASPVPMRPHCRGHPRGLLNPLLPPGRHRSLPARAGILDQCPAARVEPDTRRDRRATGGEQPSGCASPTTAGTSPARRPKPVSGCSAWPNAPNSRRSSRPGLTRGRLVVEAVLPVDALSRPFALSLPTTRPRPRRARHDPRRVPGAGGGGRRPTAYKPSTSPAAWCPDVLLVDIRMPGLDGVEVTRRVAGPDVTGPHRRRRHHDVRPRRVRPRGLRAGARGFLPRRRARTPSCRPSTRRPPGCADRPLTSPPAARHLC